MNVDESPPDACAYIQRTHTVAQPGWFGNNSHAIRIHVSIHRKTNLAHLDIFFIFWHQGLTLHKQIKDTSVEIMSDVYQ